MTESNDSNQSPDYPPSRRAAKRRPAKPIPSDRMKWDVQFKVLRTLGQLGTRTTDAEFLSKAMSGEVSHYTVALSHGFFVECGWLARVGRGEWRPTDALLGYVRQAQYNTEKALAFLREPAKDSWVWRTMSETLSNGSVEINTMLATLAHEAEADSHRTQLLMILQWFEFIGLIVVDENAVRRAEDTDGSQDHAEHADSAATANPTTTATATVVASPERQETAASVPKPTNAASGRPDALLNFDFSISLTAADLAVLTPEQISAVFEAVGKVVAIQRQR
jgi:hypothetical protein